MMEALVPARRVTTMRKPLIVSLLALMASGCMVGPDYVRPPVERAGRLAPE